MSTIGLRSDLGSQMALLGVIQFGKCVINSSVPFDLVGKTHLIYSGEFFGTLVVS